MPKCELTVNLNFHAPQERLAPHSELVLALCWRFEQPLHCLLCGHQEAITVTINSELHLKRSLFLHQWSAETRWVFCSKKVVCVCVCFHAHVYNVHFGSFPPLCRCFSQTFKITFYIVAYDGKRFVCVWGGGGGGGIFFMFKPLPKEVPHTASSCRLHTPSNPQPIQAPHPI